MNRRFIILTIIAMTIALIGLMGILISLTGLGFSAFLLIMRLIKGSEWAVQGVFTLFGVLFFFVGLQVLAIGLMGEYIGRIYEEVRARPKFIVERAEGFGKDPARR